MRKVLFWWWMLPLLAHAQPYGNEWIDFNKEYYKVTLAEDGIYRLTYDDLLQAGFPIGSNSATPVDPRRIQLFHRGQEIAIRIEGENDAVFDPGDYIEFYGQRNDGTLDAELYVDPAYQPHRYYNLYADTVAYFLTYNLIAQNGKRITSEPPFTAAAHDTWYWAEYLQLFTDEYSKGLTLSTYTNLTQFDVGEGFTGPRITEVSNPQFDINVSGLDLGQTSAPSPAMELLLVGRNEQNHDVEVYIGPDALSLRLLGSYNFSSFNTLKITENLNWSDLDAAGNMVVRVLVVDNGGEQSNLSVSYLKIRYPRQTDMAGSAWRYLEPEIKAAGGQVLQLTNIAAGSVVYDVTDPDNVLSVVDTDTDPVTLTIGFDDATVARRLAVGVPGKTPQIKRISFRQLPTTADYLFVSHKSLMQPAGGASDAVRAYAGYRAAPEGGGFDTLVVDIRQLYDQFSYGEITPLAIYRFARFMLDKGSPQYMLLIGKALDVSNKFYRNDPASFTYPELVPTAGSPGADQPFAAGLSGDDIAGYMPVGRLSVSQPQQIINYLDKVREIESTPYNALWRKNLLHLSGGRTAAELVQFKSFVDSYKAIAEDIYLGGQVATVSKATTAVVEFINVADEVNNGLNLITFFGHSAPNVTDIDIGFVSDPANGYNNKGKYPVIVMNGCNAGNIYGDSYIFGEDWIASADKGATAVIAHTSFGYTFTLRIWSGFFYEIAYGDSSFIDRSLGEIIQEVGHRILDYTGPNPSYFYLTQIQQMGLQGDPAIRLFGTKIPDYELNENNVEAVGLTEFGISSAADSLALALGVRNFGAYLPDSLEVAIRRTLPNGQVIDYDTIAFKPVAYQDTLYFVLDNRYAGNAGNNSFEIVLDPANKLPEHDKLNNIVFYNLFIPLSGTQNILPRNYAIWNKTGVDLVVQPGNTLAPSRDYLFEIDTTALFTSAAKQQNTLQGQGLITWPSVSLQAIDSLPYYWRSKYAQIQPEEADIWNEYTFTYLPNSSEGWAQVAYHQMKKNSLAGLKANEAVRRYDFLTTQLDFEVEVHGANSPDFTYEDTKLIIDGLDFIYPGTFTLCANNRLQLVAFSQETAAPYAPVRGTQTESWTCGRSPQVINSYPGGKSLDEIIDAIRPGDRVLLFTTGSFDFNTLAPATLARLEDLGATLSTLTAKTAAEAYIMYGYKGAGSGGAYAEIVPDPANGPVDQQTLTYQGAATGIYASGSMTSPDIGPALSWQQLQVNVRQPDAEDQATLDVWGKDFNNSTTLLLADVAPGTIDLSTIDAAAYPYLNLQLKVADTISRTAPQLDYWIVNYEPPAEGVLTFVGNNAGNSLQVDLQEGQPFVSRFGFVNITGTTFTDSLTVFYTLFNQDQRTSVQDNFKIAPPVPGDTTFFEINIDTKGKVGSNDLDLAVNPMLVAEQQYQNNNLSMPGYLRVKGDELNPVLDVTFDGQYIFDGDIVSPSPDIRIVIRDENPYLLKTDTTGIDIYLTRPCEGCAPERVALSGSEVSWQPQTAESPFTINYNPQNLADGIYELKVQVADASGNQAGSEPYTIRFEVINKSTVTNFYPYPNPFSTSVRFVFTLTGSELPDQILIRIFTVSGRVVREITQDELGPLRIGNNISEYAWDGRDEYGDLLANGVYLYKVYIRSGGKQIELRPSAGDRGFKHGFGKLYILR